MGCGSCGTAAGGTPSGCKSNGGCSTGGCNRMNVFDWLAELPLTDNSKPYPVMEVTFNKGSRKEFYRNNTAHLFEKGEWIAVEGVSGFDLGQISLQGELVKLQMKKYGVKDEPSMKRVLRPASTEDLDLYYQQKAREQAIMVQGRAMARVMKLDMKIAEVEMQADGKKATFFYTADNRVDFRELIKQFATEFKLKVEMRQIGARQESGKVGGIGSCGRELCCSTWLTDFKSVNTSAARYQNLSINQTKLSGQCGRLKCCLNYELDTYMDSLKHFPTDAETIETTQGRASLQKRDIFKNLMWYSYYGSNKQYPMTIERVKEIVVLNKQGIKPEELQAIELEATKSKPNLKVDMGFVNDVGQISLKALEKNSRSKKNKGNKPAGETAQGGNAKKQANPQQQGEGKKAQQQQRGDKPQGQKPQRQQQQSQKPKSEGQEQQPRPKQEGGQQPKPKQEGGQPQKPKQEGQQPKQPKQQRPPRPQQAADGSTSTPEGQAPKPQQQQRQRPERPKPSAEFRDDTPKSGEQSGEQHAQRSQRFNKPKPEGGGDTPA